MSAELCWASHPTYSTIRVDGTFRLCVVFGLQINDDWERVLWAIFQQKPSFTSGRESFELATPILFNIERGTSATVVYCSSVREKGVQLSGQELPQIFPYGSIN